MYSIPAKTLYRWYRLHLSDYQKDIGSGAWKKESIETEVDKVTGEVVKQKPLYVCKRENMGENMCIDDKQIGKVSYTIMSNQQTGKVALLVESVKSAELTEAMKYFQDQLVEVKSISCDMSSSYLKLCKTTMPNAQIVIDKFHVIRYAYDALQQVRLSIKKEIIEQLSDKKSKTKKDRKVLSDLQLLKRTRYLLNKSESDWTDDQAEMMKVLFAKHPILLQSYQLVQDFKEWYSIKNVKKKPIVIEQLLFKWYDKVEESKIKEFDGVVKMIQKHEENIINYFSNGFTNAKAERINGKIERFISNQYSVRDKDFTLYRIKGYFA